MHTQSDVFRRFLEEHGGNNAAARLLKISPSLASRIASGQRSISPELALKIELATQGRISKAALIWGAAA